MRTPNRSAMARAGFTLIEVLVTLVLVALLIGVIVPSVINQLDRGDPARIATDVESVRSAARLFRVDVKRHPHNIEQLTEDPGSDGVPWDTIVDFNGATISSGLIDRWDGPYLEGSGVVDTTTTMETALEASIHPVFRSKTLAGSSYLTLYVTGLTRSDIQNVSDLIDGDTVTTDDDAGGRLRGSTNGDTLWYLAVPVN